MGHRVSVKQGNQREVLNFLRNSGEVSVADIAARVRLSKPTIKKVIDMYQAQGLVVLTGKGESTEDGGKRPSLFRFNRNYGCILAVHLGPDFVFAALTDLAGEILHSSYVNLAFCDRDRVLTQLCATMRELHERTVAQAMRLVGIAVALPGVVDVEKGMWVFSPHFVEWGTMLPFKQMIQECLALDVPIYMDNVNRFQAFAEYVIGKGAGVRSLVIVDAIREGLGAGILINGLMHEGAESLSGEIGHMVLQPDDGPDCICGGKGCFEALVSTRRIMTTIIESRESHSDSLVYAGSFSADVELRNLFSAYREGDPFAEEVMADVVKWFAIGLNNVIMVYDPEKIILQGIYDDAGPRFLDALREKINQMSLPYLNRCVEIVFSDLGRERGVLGAALYLLSRYFESSVFL